MEETKSAQQLMWDIKRAYESKIPREEIMAMYEALPDKTAVGSDRDNSFLHLAASWAHPEAIEYLLAQGAKPGAKNRYQQTALHALANCWSENSYYAQITKEDIDRSADILIAARVSALMRDEGSGGNLCYHDALKGRENLQFLYAMMRNKVKLDMLDRDGRNVLHLLVVGPAESARHSIQYTNDEEKKALEYAKLDECFELAKALMEYGIDPEGKDQSQQSPAGYAAEKGLKKLAVLLRGEYDEADPALQDKIAAGGMTLHEAVEKKDVAAVEALIRLGADVNEVDTTEYGQFRNMTPLAVACNNLQVECVKALLAGGADVNFRGGENERGAFYYFVTNRGSISSENEKAIVEIVHLLFDAGLAPDGFVDNEGHTPINFTCEKYVNGSHAKTIRREMLDMGIGDLNIPDRNGMTPLMGLAQSRFDSPENDLITLLEFGADMTLRDKDGNTALMHAAANSNRGISLTVADLLFSFGDPQPGVVNNEGKSAMDIAVENNNEDLVKMLLAKM